MCNVMFVAGLGITYIFFLIQNVYNIQLGPLIYFKGTLHPSGSIHNYISVQVNRKHFMYILCIV